MALPRPPKGMKMTTVIAAEAAIQGPGAGPPQASRSAGKHLFPPLELAPGEGEGGGLDSRVRGNDG